MMRNRKKQILNKSVVHTKCNQKNIKISIITGGYKIFLMNFWKEYPLEDE